jgi:hypothetical protein
MAARPTVGARPTDDRHGAPDELRCEGEEGANAIPSSTSRWAFFRVHTAGGDERSPTKACCLRLAHANGNTDNIRCKGISSGPDTNIHKVTICIARTIKMGEHPVLARCKLTSLSAQTHSRPKLGLGICRHGHAAVSACVHALLTQACLLVDYACIAFCASTSQRNRCDFLRNVNGAASPSARQCWGWASTLGIEGKAVPRPF